MPARKTPPTLLSLLPSPGAATFNPLKCSYPVFLARDSDGDVGITPGATSGATQTIQVGKTTAADGTVVFAVDSDFHFDSGVGNSAAGTLYAVVKLNQGTATANIRVNWRG
jgi:hypothetical protein